ncbi:MAG: L-glutamate gamma-semialdehyde dehydrogenase [Prevotellaceae bacterium]|jgi:1-pyrroline-5-carboxylate dehydrogenase|nr:L-glutamate gamma-semialdehyde dehydrogenase [Prevotellaceae bacterium]
MNNSIFKFERPQNEPIYGYLPQSDERKKLKDELKRQSSATIEIPLIIGGKEVKTGDLGKVVMPHNHHHVLATYHKATKETVEMAINAALEARQAWANLPWTERAAVSLKIAELISKKYRYLLSAATMLGQSKNPYQAEIDCPCEAIDFLRFNAYFASMIYEDQPKSENSHFDRQEYRPLEGFVYAITPFNFTAIACNLNMAPVIMGNVTIWKPATTAILSNYYLMQIYKEAGLPDGVINFIPGQGNVISDVVFNHKAFAGVHFTGSTSTFDNFWKIIGNNIGKYNTYPKIVGETGGKDFIFVHKSANVEEAAAAMVRGSFEYQGQKCSAASRAYVPKSMWSELSSILKKLISEIKVGNVCDFRNLMNAVIDEKSFDTIMSYIEKAKKTADAEIVTGGAGDKTKGYFVEPTIILAHNPHFASMEEEIFGPVLTIYVYDDDKYEETLALCDQTSPYALTGALFAKDRYAIKTGEEKLKYACGNFYINDKPTGAVVGQQPFGGARRSGTNDKAGFHTNLMRWVSPQAIKETYNPSTQIDYAYMSEE